MAIGFAAFPRDNGIRRKNMQSFVKNGPNLRILAHYVKKNKNKNDFQCEFAAREFNMM